MTRAGGGRSAFALAIILAAPALAGCDSPVMLQRSATSASPRSSWTLPTAHL